MASTEDSHEGLGRIDISALQMPENALHREKLTQCVVAYNDDKCVLAATILHELDVLAAEDAALKQYLSQPALSGLRKISFEQEKLFHMLSEDAGWTVVMPTTECRRKICVWYRNEGNAMHSFKFEGTLRAPLLHCLTLVNEIPLWGQWLPFLTRTEETKRFTPNCRIAVVEWPMVYPMYWRDICVRGIASDLLDENNGILVTCKNFENPPEKSDSEFPSRRGVCRISCNYGAMWLNPISKKEFKFTAILNVDPKLKYFPMSLINYAAVYVAYYGILYFEKRGRSLAKGDPATDPHLMKMAQDREFYGEIEERLTKFEDRVELPPGGESDDEDEDSAVGLDSASENVMDEMKAMNEECQEGSLEYQEKIATDSKAQSWSSWFWGTS